MARFFAFFTLFHLSLTFFRPEVPFKIEAMEALLWLIKCVYFILTHQMYDVRV